MSSNIRVKRLCQHCGIEFEAKTTVTKYCGDPCSKLAYKARLRNEKVKVSNEQVKLAKEKPFQDLRAKDILTVRDAAKILNSSIRAIYNMIDSGRIQATKLSERKTLIKRSEIDKLFEIPEGIKFIKSAKQNRPLKIEECYTMSEIQMKFGISEAALYNMIKRNNIPKFQKGKYVYTSKSIIDELLTVNT